MPKHNYSVKPEKPEKTAKAAQDYVRVHFKNTHAVARALKGMKLQRAKKFLNNVLRKQETVPIYRFKGGYGRHAGAKNWGVSQCFWPTKSVYAFLRLLQNAEANAKSKGLEYSRLVISHVQTQAAPKIRRRTFRAHGRINAFQASPSHIEVVLTEGPAEKKEETKQ